MVWYCTFPCFGSEFTKAVDLDDENYSPTGAVPDYLQELNINTLTHRDAVISSLVYIHKTIDEANQILVKQQGRQNYVTPRHYLDFISHIVKLVNDKRSELEEQQLHLNVGLQKLKETAAQVESMQESLGKKRIELETKQKEADIKLKQMIGDQKVAETKKSEAETLKTEVESKSRVIEEERRLAYADLDKAEPALHAAQQAVSGISPKQLQTIRAYGNPPEPIKLIIEAVCILLGNKNTQWAELRKKLINK